MRLCLQVFMVVCGAAVGCNNATTVEQQNLPVATAQQEAGKSLFTAHCANCHKINADMSGPALRHAVERWPNKATLYAFVRNSAAVIDTNAYARQLYLQYNQTPMPTMPQLTNQQIDQIFDYVAANSKP
jgi:mono/diheme cytochrome c family protein